MLDVIYSEDACRVRKDYSLRTLALIRKTALAYILPFERTGVFVSQYTGSD